MIILLDRKEKNMDFSLTPEQRLLQKMMAEIFEKLTRAAGMELTLPV